MARYFEFGAAEWERLERDWNAWWANELERPLVTIATHDPGERPPPGDDFLTRFPIEQPADEVVDYFHRRLEKIQYYGDSYPKYWVNFGAGIIAAFLGSGVQYDTGTTWFHPLPVNSLDEIELVYDPNNVWWKRAQDITRAATKRWNGQVTVAYTDIGGNMDILASLRGTQNLLMDAIDVPEVVSRQLNDITRLWMRYFEALEALMPPNQHGRCAWAPPWSPTRGYMLQSDFCYMISPEMFERFVLPDLSACCDFLDYPFYHMDGKGQLVHLDMLLSLEKLRGIQWQPGDGQPLADQWLSVLKRIRDGGKLCQVYVTLEGALTIARELGGKGFLFDIIDQGKTITPGDLDDFNRALNRLQ